MKRYIKTSCESNQNIFGNQKFSTFDEYFQDYMEDEDVWNMSLETFNAKKARARELWNRRNVDFQGYVDVTYKLRTKYGGSIDAMMRAGYKPINGFRLSDIVEGNVVACDIRTKERKVVLLIWDPASECWLEAAEKPY